MEETKKQDKHMSGLSGGQVMTMTVMMAPVPYCALFSQSIGGLQHDFLSWVFLLFVSLSFSLEHSKACLSGEVEKMEQI